MTWIVENQGEYVEVKPTDDTKEHFAGDECWCNPTIEKHDLAVPMFTHNHSGELKTDSNWRNVSYATNLFMFKNGFTYDDQGKFWISKPDSHGNSLRIEQSVAEYFVRAML